MAIASDADGRTISLNFSITLTPPEAPTGATDNALTIGRGLIRESMARLKASAERDGFVVEIVATNTIY